MWSLRFSNTYLRTRRRNRLSTVTEVPPVDAPLIPLQVQSLSYITVAVFPNEIFTLIFEYLDDYHLYLVCTLSRCLNELALRVFFSRFHGADLSFG